MDLRYFCWLRDVDPVSPLLRTHAFQGLKAGCQMVALEHAAGTVGTSQKPSLFVMISATAPPHSVTTYPAAYTRREEDRVPTSKVL